MTCKPQGIFSSLFLPFLVRYERGSNTERHLIAIKIRRNILERRSLRMYTISHTQLMEDLRINSYISMTFRWERDWEWEWA